MSLARIEDKLSRPFKDLRISVTDRCNFRCTYCMPAEIYGESYKFLPKIELLTFEEIVRISKIMIKLGATKIRITGGEPLVRKSIEDLVAMLAKINGIEDLTMTTNSYLLPGKVKALRESGLNRITTSLDTLDDEIFKEMNGRGFGVDKVLEGITSAEASGFFPIKVNAVVQRGVNDHTVVQLASYFKERGHIVRFIEYMDVGTRNGWSLANVVSGKEIVEMINEVMPLEPIAANYTGEVATRYKYVDGEGEIGLINSVTEPFCGDCTRLRLSPEGKIFTCLFGSEGTDLREPMRMGADDSEIEKIIRRTWIRRIDRYSEARSSMTEALRNSRKKVEMYHIGG